MLVTAATVCVLSSSGSHSAGHVLAETSAPAIVIHAKRYAFVPSQITLQAGRTVRLTFISDDVPHSIAIPGLQIDVPIAGNPVSEVVITPSAAGDFTGMCTRYCGADHDKIAFVVHVIEQRQ
ncbi:cupredoxin domain-containing protein [Silvibacterium dinghuense]|uniref:Cytochrome oxidase subunit II copper A binding domain-containing protein n=1 Tax=Silvibacterium dinghuense TaxID=1560006 RepID=A0A4V1NVX6_9BACT|nr:cupredoxin domain-containing protein [Silvibacterium dinghuense]RXS97452.1 hypothetical protein ESZ00_06020 [Silvibacterium dinghuense]GGG99120.1 hypothetical protein GCM10011586_13280 [Silvibacterium dinghuense]